MQTDRKLRFSQGELVNTCERALFSDTFMIGSVWMESDECVKFQTRRR